MADSPLPQIREKKFRQQDITVDTGLAESQFNSW